MAASLLLYRRIGKGFKNPDPSALPVLNALADGQYELVWGPWHVPGMFGIINNAFACAFMALVWFFSFWPPSTPTLPDNMNFAVAMTGGVLVFSIIYYFLWARRVFKGPVREVEMS